MIPGAVYVCNKCQLSLTVSFLTTTPEMTWRRYCRRGDSIPDSGKPTVRGEGGAP